MLRQQEQQKCREHRQIVPTPGALQTGVIPCVFERGGLTAPCAFHVMQWLQQQRGQYLHRRGLNWRLATQQASTELWTPLSACLLRADAHALQACCAEPCPTP
eukprot:1348450-Amphidinium_carterae.1